ncbi:MAG: CPBP family intramembrane metalloprotease [Deltaproteobacteria bacterium]|nr:CPBP family intramembrane metalloprotease [Deltaproteobacteria bacterium]
MRPRTVKRPCLSALVLVPIALLLAGRAAAEPPAHADSPRRTDKSPAGAAALSVLFPGAGHFYLGDPATGAGLSALGALELGALVGTALDGWPEGGLDADPSFMLSALWYQNTWLYGIFAAWRDARLARDGQDLHHPLPGENLDDLLWAPFDPDTFFEPEVALGLVGMLGLGVLATWLISDHLVGQGGTVFERDELRFMGQRLHPGLGAPLGEVYYLGLFAPVGIGEEAFFRGLVQTSLSERVGDWGGWALSSLIFAAAHAPNAMAIEDEQEQLRYLTIGLPLMALTGAYLGWVYMHNHYSLKESVALHFWYDFLLSSLSFALDPDGQPFAVRICMPF